MELFQVFGGIETKIKDKKIKTLKIRQDCFYLKNICSTLVEAKGLNPISTKLKGDIIITNIENIPSYKEIKILFSFHSNSKIEKIETKMKNDKIIIDKIKEIAYKVFSTHSELYILNEDFILEYEIDEEILKKPVLLLKFYINDYFLYYSFNPTKLTGD